MREEIASYTVAVTKYHTSTTTPINASWLVVSE